MKTRFTASILIVILLLIVTCPCFALADDGDGEWVMIESHILYQGPSRDKDGLPYEIESKDNIIYNTEKEHTVPIASYSVDEHSIDCSLYYTENEYYVPDDHSRTYYTLDTTRTRLNWTAPPARIPNDDTARDISVDVTREYGKFVHFTGGTDFYGRSDWDSWSQHSFKYAFFCERYDGKDAEEIRVKNYDNGITAYSLNTDYMHSSDADCRDKSVPDSDKRSRKPASFTETVTLGRYDEAWYGEENSILCVYFIGEADWVEEVIAYIYEWVSDDEKAGIVKPSDGPIHEEIETTAIDEAGEDGGVEINSDIVNGTEDKGKKAPGAIVTAAGVIAAGGIAIAVASGKKKKHSGENENGRISGKEEKKDDPEKEKKKSSFRMILYKEFGDTLVIGDGREKIGARIEETTGEGKKVDRKDLTACIKILGGTAIKVSNVQMSGSYMCAEIEPENKPGESHPKEGSIRLLFTGKGGSLEETVIFKIESETDILFADNNLTFVAGDHQTLSMQFVVSGMGDSPELEAELQGENASNFEKVRIELVDAQYHIYKVEMTECGKTGTTPGAMESVECVVTAGIHTSTGYSKQQGSFGVYRFHEGIQMRLDEIRCYLVPDNDTGSNDPEDDPKKAVLTPAHTRVELTLYTWDWKDESQTEGVIMTPVPDKYPEFTFEDVEDGILFGDMYGEDVSNPCEKMQFTYAFKSIHGNTNTLTGEIYATTGFLLPPNRGTAKVTVSLEYKGKKYSAQRKVDITSMPRRSMAGMSEYSAYKKKDGELKQKLEHIKSQILNNEYGREMRPMLYKIELMLDGYHPDYGYYMPDYYRVMNTFARFASGELGSAEANDLALFGNSVAYDTFVMTLGTMNKSGSGIAARIICGVISGGASEVVFMPAQIAGEMKDYVDQGGSSIVGGWCIGIKSFAVDYVTGKVIGKGVEIGGKALKAGAKALTETAVWGKALELSGKFTSAGLGKELSAASSALSGQIKNAKASVDANIRKYRKLLDSDVLEIRSEAYVYGRKVGLQKVKQFERALQNPEMTEKELRVLALEIQGDKHAMNQLMLKDGAVHNPVRAKFSSVIGEVHDEAILEARKRLAKKAGCKLEEIDTFQATGNDGTAILEGRKVSMDKDITFRRKVNGKWVDIDEDIAGEIYNDCFFEAATGTASPNKRLAAQFAAEKDVSIVDVHGKESYGKDYERAMNKSRIGEKFEDIEKLTSTMEYKNLHWLKRSDELKKLAAEAGAINDIQSCWYNMAQSEALVEEGIRQTTKQFDRITLPRLEFLAAKGKHIKTGKLLEKIELMKKLGIGGLGPTKIDVAELEVVLKNGYNSTIEETVKEITELMKTINDAV